MWIWTVNISLLLVKKTSSFARHVTEIFNFFFGKVTFGSPCIYIWNLFLDPLFIWDVFYIMIKSLHNFLKHQWNFFILLYISRIEIFPKRCVNTFGKIFQNAPRQMRPYITSQEWSKKPIHMTFHLQSKDRNIHVHKVRPDRP